VLWHTDAGVFKLETKSADRSQKTPEIREEQFIKPCYWCGLIQQPATRTTQLFTRFPLPQWDGEENGQKVKLVG